MFLRNVFGTISFFRSRELNTLLIKALVTSLPGHRRNDFSCTREQVKLPKNLLKVSLYRKDGTGQLSSVDVVHKHTRKCINQKILWLLYCRYTATSIHACDPPHYTLVFLQSVLYENASIFYTWRRVIRAKPSRAHRETLYVIRAKLYCDSTLFLKCSFRGTAI